LNGLQEISSERAVGVELGLGITNACGINAVFK
jgi:hypothetical protein